MSARYTKAQARASKKYHEETDEIRVRTEKGNHEKYARHARKQGETLKQFVNRALEETYEHDRENG